MNQIITIDRPSTPVAVEPPARTNAMILADATNATQRALIDQFSRLSTRQREALYAMRQHHRLEKIHDKFEAQGHRLFSCKIVVCLCEAHLAKMVFGKINSRRIHYAVLSGLGKRMMATVQSLDAVFFQNVAEIGAGK